MIYAYSSFFLTGTYSFHVSSNITHLIFIKLEVLINYFAVSLDKEHFTYLDTHA